MYNGLITYSLTISLSHDKNLNFKLKKYQKISKLQSLKISYWVNLTRYSLFVPFFLLNLAKYTYCFIVLIRHLSSRTNFMFPLVVRVNEMELYYSFRKNKQNFNNRILIILIMKNNNISFPLKKFSLKKQFKFKNTVLKVHF